jgi:hypothetical protein
MNRIARMEKKNINGRCVQDNVSFFAPLAFLSPTTKDGLCGEIFPSAPIRSLILPRIFSDLVG